MVENSQSRKYILEINNPNTYGFSHDSITGILDMLSINYYCYSDEISPSGTYHTHIFIYSQNPIRFSLLKRRFPIAHIERAYGTVQQNRDYILKSGKWKDTKKAETSIADSFFEKGDIPTEGNEKSPLLSQLIEIIKQGETTASIIEKNPKFAFRTKDIDTLRQTLLSEKYNTQNRNLEVFYYFGKTGTGKTSEIYKKYSPRDVCRITNYKNDKVNFDSYYGQDVLVFEEFRSQIPIAEILSYLDIYPLQLPARFNDKVACYTKVYLLTNIPLSSQYTNIQKDEIDTWHAFLRRINIVKEFLSNGKSITHIGGNSIND